MCCTVKGCYGYAGVGGYIQCVKKKGTATEKKRGKAMYQNLLSQIVRDNASQLESLLSLLIAFDIFHFNQEKLNNILPCHQKRLFPCLSRLS